MKYEISIWVETKESGGEVLDKVQEGLRSTGLPAEDLRLYVQQEPIYGFLRRPRRPASYASMLLMVLLVAQFIHLLVEQADHVLVWMFPQLADSPIWYVLPVLAVSGALGIVILNGIIAYRDER